MVKVNIGVQSIPAVFAFSKGRPVDGFMGALPDSRYASIGDLPPVIPVFPLRQALLLPRVSLPLNIFEQRYLAMVEPALGNARIIGMVPAKGS